MSRANTYASGSAKRRSGWLIPLAVFFVTACLSALVLAYYFAPEPSRLSSEMPAPTDATRAIALTMGTTRFRIPANYIPLASTRKGGPMNRIAIAALLPDLEGYTLGSADAYADMGPEARLVAVTLQRGPAPPAEKDRLARIYVPLMQNAEGTLGPYGLRQYAFRADTGYHDQDLFVGQTDLGPLILLCTKLSADVAAPSCLRDTGLGPDIVLSYRFKRAYLKDWRTIDGKVQTLLASFADKS